MLQVEQFEGNINALLESPVDLNRFSRYRNHKIFNREQLREIFGQKIRSLLNSNPVAFVLRSERRFLGLCVCTPLAWDSGHFGLAMGRLDAFLAAEVSLEDADRLLQATIACARTQRQITHYSCHVDADDYVQFNALVKAGFFLTDTKGTFIARRNDPLRTPANRPFCPRPYQAEDCRRVIAFFEQCSFTSRFSRDPQIDPEKSRAMYLLWAERLLDTATRNTGLFYVVERQNAIVAAGGNARVDFHFTAGKRTMFTDGVFACLPRAAGAYLSTMSTLIEEGMARGCDATETIASLNNRPATRVLTRLGDMVAVEHALHLHKD